MTDFKVSLEVTFQAENPLDAAKKLVQWLQDGAEFIYDVTNIDTKESFTVDLAESDEDAVLPNN